MNMNKEYVPYEQALEIKELGFDEPCFGFYHINSGYTIGYAFCYSDVESQPIDGCSAPLYQQAFRFIREKYGYNCFVTSSILDGTWYYFRENLKDRKKDSDPELTPHFETPEEAERICLINVIDIIKKEMKS